MTFDAIEDLEAWFIENSQPGFGPFVPYRNRDFGAYLTSLLEQFQLGLFSDALRKQRAGGQGTPALADLEAQVERHNDGLGYTIYRGLGGVELSDTSVLHRETTLNSWSLYPSKALRLALLHADAPYCILRLKLGESAKSLYIDEWEDEFLCVPMDLDVGAFCKGEINFLSEKFTVRVIDCYLKGA